MRNVIRLGLPIVTVVVAVLLTFMISDYRLSQLSKVALFSVALLGLNLLTGYNGQISLGHGAFYALGAYTTGVMVTRWHVPYLSTVVAAAAITFVVGFLFGIPALRLRGISLALVTLALAVALPQILKRFSWITHGTEGIVVPRMVPPDSVSLSQDQFLYLICVIVTIIFFILGWNLTRARMGRAMVAIRDNHVGAASMGIDLNRVKILTFAVSAAFAGVAGALATLTIGFVSPDDFTLAVSIAFLTGIVVGGLSTVSGAIIGALFLVYTPIYANEISRAAPGFVYGAILILVMLLIPNGAVGLVRRASAIAGRGVRPAST
jgi:branched-chain amino acid transport system permease protein